MFRSFFNFFYRPPSSSLTIFDNLFDILCSFKSSLFSNFILLGDFNIERPKKHFKNEKRSKDAAAKKRPNTSGIGKINNYYEDIYIPPYNNTD